MTPHNLTKEQNERFEEKFDKMFELCWEIEKLPASEQQTKVVEMAREIRKELQDFWEYVKETHQNELSLARTELIKEIEVICDEQTMPRIWNLDKEQIEKFIKISPAYEPERGEEYQVGFVRGETWGALKIKNTFLSKLKQHHERT